MFGLTWGPSFVDGNGFLADSAQLILAFGHSFQEVIFDNAFILSIMIVTAIAWGIPLAKYSSDDLLEVSHGSRPLAVLLSSKIWLVISVILALLLNGYPRLASSIPVGGDTYPYAYILNLVNRNGMIWAFGYLDRPVTYLLFSIIQNGIGLSSLDIFRFIPETLAALFVISTYYYSRKIVPLKSPWRTPIASLSALLAASTTFLLRSYIDLYSQMLAMTLANGIFYFLLKYDETKRSKWVFAASVSLLAMVLIHWPFFLILSTELILLSVLLFVDKGRRPELPRAIIRILSVPYALLLAIVVIQYSFPNTATVAFYLVSTLFPPKNLLGYSTQFNLAGTSGTGFWDPNAPVNSFQYYAHRVLLGDISPFWGNPIPSLLAIAPFAVLARVKSLGQRTLAVQVMILSVLILSPLGAFAAQTYRFALLLPIPIAASYGFVHATQAGAQLTRRFSRSIKGLATPLAKIGLLLLVMALILTSVLTAIQYQDRLATSPFSVSSQALDEINWVRDTYGVNNQSLVMVVRDIPGWDFVTASITPRVVYFGDLAYLIANKSEPQILNTPTSLHPSQYVAGLESLEQNSVLHDLRSFTIIVTANTYYPTSIEMKYLIPIHEGVFVVSSTAFDQIDSLLSAWLDFRYYGWTPSATNFTSVASEGNTSAWTVTNNGQGDAVISTINDSSITAVYSPTTPGYNLELRYLLPSSMNVSDFRFLSFQVWTSATPSNFRVWLDDPNGNYTYWELTGIEPLSYPPLGGWKQATWLQFTLRLGYPTYSSGNFDLKIVYRLRFSFTPGSQDQSVTMAVSQAQFNRGDLSRAPLPLIPNLLLYNPSISPLAVLLGTALIVSLMFAVGWKDLLSGRFLSIINKVRSRAKSIMHGV